MSRGYPSWSNNKPQQLSHGLTAPTRPIAYRPRAKFDEWSVTSDGRSVTLIIGDSKQQGTADDVVLQKPTDADGTGFEFNTRLKQLGRFDLETVNLGSSPWPAYCREFYRLTNIRKIIVNSALTGSQFINSGTAGLSWYTNGTLYPAAVVKAKKALSAVNLSRLTVIIGLGINDIGSAETTANVGVAVTSLIERLNTDFNKPTILIHKIGINNGFGTARYGIIKNFVNLLPATYPNVHLSQNENSLYGWGLYGTSNLHYKKAGNDMVGIKDARYEANIENDTDRDVRTALNAFYDPLTNIAKNSWRNFIQRIGPKGINAMASLDTLQIYKATSRFNQFIDVVGYTAPLAQLSGTSFETKYRQSAAFNGVDTVLNTYWGPLPYAIHATQNDILMGMGVVEANTTAGTLATIFSLFRTGVNTYTTDTKIQPNTRYAVARNGTTEELLKFASVVRTGTISSVGFPSGPALLGDRLNASPDTGVAGEFWNGSMEYFYVAPYVGFPQAQFEALLSEHLQSL